MNRATLLLPWQYSWVRTSMSPRMGMEYTRRTSRLLRILFGREVYETAHIMSEMEK